MSANTTPIFVAAINNKGQSWTHSDSAATTKDVFVAASNGSRCFGIAATLTDTTAVDVQIFIYDGATAWLAGTVTVAIGAGNTGSVSAQNLLSLSNNPWLNSDGSITLPTGWKIQASNVTQLASGKTLTLVALGGDY